MVLACVNTGKKLASPAHYDDEVAYDEATIQVMNSLADAEDARLGQELAQELVDEMGELQELEREILNEPQSPKTKMRANRIFNIIPTMFQTAKKVVDGVVETAKKGLGGLVGGLFG